MDYLDFGDNIDYNKFNALVYLLRKFKKLTSELELGAYDINTDYGNFHFTDGFVPVGNNWILEDNVTVTGSNVLLNSFYTFVFTVVDVNTSGVVNKRLIRVTSESTGETGNLSLLIPSDLINNDEVILPIFDLEVVFDEHEYYTPLPDVHLSLSVDKRIIEAGEVATITGLLTDSTSTPIENVSLPLIVGGTTVTVITDSTGEFNYVYTGTGTRGKVLVSALGESVFFYDGLINIMGATVTGNNVSLGVNDTWLITTGDVVIDWGDGTSDTVNNPSTTLSHTYTDGLNEHLIIFDGTVTSLGVNCFYGCSGLTSIVIPDGVTSLGSLCFYGCSGLTSIVIPDGVTSLGDRCFYGCSGLTSVTIPDSITSIGNSCFYQCYGLIDYELYWETQPVTYDSTKMIVNNGTVFTIPYGTSSIYTNAGYPVANLVEREPLEPLDTTLSIASDKQTIYTDETIIITGTLLDEDNNPVKQASVKLYDGNTLLDTLTTDNNGIYTKTISNLSVGSHSLHTSFEGTSNFNASTSSNIIITVSEHNYNLVLSSDTPIIQKTETAIVNALLTHNGSAYSSQSLSYTVKHGSTTIDTGTVTTGSDGKASISYTGTGVGDVEFIVEFGSILQKTYELEDCDIYDTTEHTKSYSTTKFETIASITDLSDVSISLDLKTTTYNYSCVFGIGYNSESDQIGFGTTDTVGRIYRTLNGINNHLNYSQFNQNNVYYNLRFERTGNTLKTYLNNVLIDTSTDNEISTFTYLNFGSWRTKTIYYKNLKVKAL